jgi:hypothetical protein
MTTNLTQKPIHAYLGRFAIAMTQKGRSPDHIGAAILDTVLHVTTTAALDLSDMQCARHEVRRRLHRAADEYTGLVEGAAIQEERLLDRRGSLISMSQTLAASRHGSPLDIPSSVIDVAVADVNGILGLSDDSCKEASDEIFRRVGFAPSGAGEAPCTE